MKVVRSYSNIWRVEKIIYGWEDIRLPRPVPLSTAVWAVLFFLLSLVMKGIPPFIFDGFLVNNFFLPCVFAYGMGKMKFEDKSPLGYFRSVVLYLCRPKTYVRGKYVRCGDFIVYDGVQITVGKEEQTVGDIEKGVSD